MGTTIQEDNKMSGLVFKMIACCSRSPKFKTMNLGWAKQNVPETFIT